MKKNDNGMKLWRSFKVTQANEWDKKEKENEKFQIKSFSLANFFFLYIEEAKEEKRQ